MGSLLTFSFTFTLTIDVISGVKEPYAEWEIIEMPGYEEHDHNAWFQDIEFINASHGWLAGRGLGVGEILHSSDGGLTWSVQLESHLSFYKIEIMENHTLWTVVGSSVCKSIDGGVNWYITPTEFSSLKKIVFYNSTLGFIGGNDGFAITKDGGISWTSITNPFDLYNSKFPDDMSITPSNLRVASSNGLFISYDMGLTWEKEIDRVTDGFCFLNEDLGWVVHGETYSEFDGRIWNEHEFFGPLSNFRARGYNDVYFVDAQHGWIVGTGPSISYTRDGGLTWYEQIFEDEYLISVSAINGSHCWVAGAWGVVARTTTGDGLGPMQHVGYKFSTGFTMSWSLIPYIPTLTASLASWILVITLIYYRERWKEIDSGLSDQW
jgi:photosystem II stability/assembly factor-like uncharacterized protein